MNLNHLAIALIELDPENLSDVEAFKKTLLLTTKKAKGHLKEILAHACADIEEWSVQDLDARRKGIIRLGELLEKGMDLDVKNSSGSKTRKTKSVSQEEGASVKFTLSKEFDADLLNEFIVENMECSNMAESAILEWEKNPDNKELLNTIFRGFHTIKGTSSFLNLDCVKDLAHQSESMLSRVRDGQDVFTIDHANLALKSLDMIKIILERMKSSAPGKQIDLPSGHKDLVEALRDFVSGTKIRQPDNPPSGAEAGPAIKDSPVRKEKEISVEKPSPAGQAFEFTSESTVRVKIDRLDKLLDTVGELVIAQTMVGQDELILSGKNHELNKKISQAGKIVRELHDLSMVLRMVPLKSTFQKMARLARDLSQKSGKMIKFIIEGEDIEIDRNMVDMMADPLIHLIRNAIDHGIEPPGERRKAGKPEEGHIYLTAGHVESSIMLTISDDGRGLSRRKVLEKAAAKGLIDSDERLSDQDVWQIIFQPGFSTADEVTEVSGRGVGMDVVRQAVEALRGRIEVNSTEGQGSSFVMKMPLTMAITDGMVVKVGSEKYILPTINIQKAIRPAESDIHTVNQRAEMLLFREEVIPVIRLHRLFDVPDALTRLTSGLLVVLGEGKKRCALFVDDLLYQTQVVTKLLGRGLSHVPGIAGGAIMGDGTVGLILDVPGIISMARQQITT